MLFEINDVSHALYEGIHVIVIGFRWKNKTRKRRKLNNILQVISFPSRQTSCEHVLRLKTTLFVKKLQRP